MSNHPMTLVLAGRIALELLFIFLGMFAVGSIVGAWLEFRSESYPEPIDDALSGYSEDDSDYQDFEEGTEPPRAA